MGLIGIPDDFALGTAPSGARWAAWGTPAPVLSAQRLRLQSAAATTFYTGVTANDIHSLIGNEFFAKVVPSPTTGSHDHIMEFLRDDFSVRMSIFVSGTNLVWGIDGGRTDVGAYDPVNHAWWKISESNGDVSFWTSPDGLTWNLLGTIPTPDWANSGVIQLVAGHWQVEAANTDTYFDNFNVGPATRAFPTGPATLSWSGRNWSVRENQNLSEPGPNWWSRSTDNVRVEGTELVISIANNGANEQQWTSSEIDCQDHCGYGTYRWVVNSRLDTIDAYEVLGLFTYGGPPPSANEIDIEAARWGKPTGRDGSATVWEDATLWLHNVKEFDFSNKPPYVCEFTWEPGKLTWLITDSDEDILFYWVVTEKIPVPSTEVPVVNYWRFQNRAPLTPKSIRIASFTFIANAKGPVIDLEQGFGDPDAFGNTLYEGLEPVATNDADNSYHLRSFARSLGRMFSEQEYYARDQGNYPGWSPAVDVDRCPVDALPWLAQFAGVRIPEGVEEHVARQYIRDRAYARRGTPASILAAAKLHLTGNKTVQIIERNTSPYNFLVVVNKNDAPPTDVAGSTFIVRDDILTVKPAGLQFTVVFVEGYVWQQATKTWNSATIKWDESTGTAT